MVEVDMVEEEGYFHHHIPVEFARDDHITDNMWMDLYHQLQPSKQSPNNYIHSEVELDTTQYYLRWRGLGECKLRLLVELLLCLPRLTSFLLLFFCAIVVGDCFFGSFFLTFRSFHFRRFLLCLRYLKIRGNWRRLKCHLFQRSIDILRFERASIKSFLNSRMTFAELIRSLRTIRENLFYL